MFCKFLNCCVLSIRYNILYIYVFLAKSTRNNSKGQWNNTQEFSLSSTNSSSSTKYEIQSTNASLSKTILRIYIQFYN